MYGFEELNLDLTPVNRRVTTPEEAVRGKDSFFGEAPLHESQLQWSWAPFLEAVNGVLDAMLSPFRAIMRVIARS